MSIGASPAERRAVVAQAAALTLALRASARSSAWLAAMVGLSEAMVRLQLAGRRSISLVQLVSYCQTLGVPVKVVTGVVAAASDRLWAPGGKGSELIFPEVAARLKEISPYSNIPELLFRCGALPDDWPGSGLEGQA